MAEFHGNKKKDMFGGTDGDDLAFGAGGRDTLSGGKGADVLVGEQGADRLDGGDGDDILYSGAIDPDFGGFLDRGVSYDVGTEKDKMVGGAGDDYIFAGVGDTVDGGERGSYGNRLYISFMGASEGVSADFREIYQSGVVKIAGGAIRNIDNVGYLEGSEFDDFLVPIDTGYPSGPNVYGRGGDDHIIADYYDGWGGSGLWGGDGDDLIEATTAAYGPKVYGEDGDDVLHLRSSYSDTAYGGAGDDTITGGGAVYGGDGNDTVDTGYNGYGTHVSGEAGNDTLTGGAGIDQLNGGADNDVIDGGGGDDVLTAGAGVDALTGGVGADTFVFVSGDLSRYLDQADRITDFNHREHDRINLAAIDADAPSSGVDHFTFIGEFAFSGQAGELRYGFVDGDTLIEGDTNGDGEGDVFLWLDGEVALTGRDFALRHAQSAEIAGGDVAAPHLHPFDAPVPGVVLA